ncbi:hypothetical protein LCGC14_0390610 [marine sediment metagenome]|uniref:Uncharacterized protein n=1 Tax=marine sediment metagenome TaxID=412755 RepID=A0A0F9VLT4_9ZZZZ
MRSENNTNIAHINSIEGLLSQVNEHLDQIEPENPKQQAQKSMAIEEIDVFQKTTLFDMRTLFE